MRWCPSDCFTTGARDCRLCSRGPLQRDFPRATRPRNRLIRGALAVVSALSVGLGALVAAPAAPAGNVVVMGDSYAANPDQYYNTLRGIDGFVPDNYPVTGNCLQAPNNWPRLMQQRHNLPVTDWSCSGLTSHSALSRIDHAVNAGAIHRGTRTVVLNYGINNFGPAGGDNGANFLDPGDVRARYLADVRAAAKVRAAAPGVNIVLTGQMAITSDMIFCMANVVPNFPAGLPVPVLSDVEAWLQGNQREAARQIGASFVDLKAETACNATCAPDDQRYVAGILDTTTPHYNMMIHPSLQGSTYVADRMAGAV